MILEVFLAVGQLRIVEGWTSRCEGTGHVELVALADLDGDGVSEVGATWLVPTPKASDSTAEPRKSAPDLLPREWERVGVVRILSGRTGEVLEEFVDTERGLPGATFGQSLELLRGAHSGDGPWLVLGQPFTEEQRGRVVCIDASTGHARFIVEGESRLDQLGSDLAIMDDLDGDGQDDVAVAAAGTRGFEGQHMSDCFISIISGATGVELRKLSPDPSDNRPLLFRAEDASGDGIAELGIVLAKRGDLDEGRPARPRLLLMDLAKERILQDVTLPDSGAGNANGWASFVRCDDDLDGDGSRDILVGVASPVSGREVEGPEPEAGHDAARNGSPANDGKKRTWSDAGGIVHVLSGITGQVIRSYGGGAEPDGFGVLGGALGDINGDGVREIVVYSSRLPKAYLIIDGQTGERLAEMGTGTDSSARPSMAIMRSPDGGSSVVIGRNVGEKGTSGIVELQLLTIVAE